VYTFIHTVYTVFEVGSRACYGNARLLWVSGYQPAGETREHACCTINTNLFVHV
jgi:hypothetical protein